MSKKTRKKSPKTPAAKPARAKTAGRTAGKTAGKPKNTPKNTSKSASSKPAGTSARTGQAKTKKATAKVSASASKKPVKALHKAPSKPLKPTGLSESVAPRIAASKAPAPKPAVVSPAADKTPDQKTGAPRQLSEGAKAPAFRLPRDGGDSVSLGDFKGRNLVLFFYPRADTPGCTKEAIDFSRLSGAFAEAGTAVLGVSADPPKAQEAFRDKHELVTPLVSDEQHEMLDAYGVWGEKSMYGRTFLGISRTTVLVGADGRIIRIWRNVKVDGHADEVLAAVRDL